MTTDLLDRPAPSGAAEHELARMQIAPQLAEVVMAVRGNHFYRNIAAVAVAQDWTYSMVPLGRGSLEVSDRTFPKFIGEGADHPWQRVIVVGSGSAATTLTLQPVFQDQLDLHVPSFVRVLNGQYDAVSPSLNVLQPDDRGFGRTLHRFGLPQLLADCLSQPVIDTTASVRV